ncbi:alpha/beta hydrolase [Terasakiispira papahanaumokuakeensis]|nr:alpha/beta hydrolase [Terasakiispira papahanaumokuakeensis]
MPVHELMPVPEGAREACWHLPHRQLRGLVWGEPQAPRVLALHGWLDSAISFAQVGPALAAAGWQLVAPDFAGHGFSDWHPAGQDYAMASYVSDIYALMEHQQWAPIPIVGHSMGAGIAGMLAAVAPEQVSALVLLDGLGTLPTSDEEAPAQMARALKFWWRRLNQPPKLSRFADLNAATQARMLGIGDVTEAMAWTLCQRALRPVTDDDHEADGWAWRSDPRLMAPSWLRLTEAQNLAFLRAITCPVTMLEADQGFLVARDFMPPRREVIEQLTYHRLPGGHHFHLDVMTCASVCEHIRAALSSL